MDCAVRQKDNTSHLHNQKFPKTQWAPWHPSFTVSLEIFCVISTSSVAPACLTCSGAAGGEWLPWPTAQSCQVESSDSETWPVWLVLPHEEVGCRGMNVRNAQECRWAPWIQFKAMRGARAIEWVLPPYPKPRPKSSFSLQTSSLLMACRVSSRSFSTPEMELLIHYGL